MSEVKNILHFKCLTINVNENYSNILDIFANNSVFLSPLSIIPYDKNETNIRNAEIRNFISFIK